MGYETKINEEGGSRLLRLLGLGSKGSAGQAAAAASPSTYHSGRAKLLDQICEFLLTHDLPITEANLCLVHSIKARTDPRLVEAVENREAQQEPITQEWLDTLERRRMGDGDPGKELDTLAKKLDESVSKLGETTRSAGQAASNYGDELQKQVHAVEQADAAENVVASLVTIAGAMLERTREMESEMRRGEHEARELRRSLEEARRDAALDYLTRLPNRRAFEKVFEREWLTAQRELEPLSMALCDIDFFKRVNDVHGHDTGDRVIRAVGQALNQISDRCHVARHGGEEFALLFRGLDLKEAADALDEAREKLAARKFIDKVSGQPIGGVTFSGGIVSASGESDYTAIMRAADEALYRAKQLGRNRIEIG